MDTLKQIATWIAFIAVTYVSYLFLKKNRKINDLTDDLYDAKHDIKVLKSKKKMNKRKEQFYAAQDKYHKLIGKNDVFGGVLVTFTMDPEPSADDTEPEPTSSSGTPVLH